MKLDQRTLDAALISADVVAIDSHLRAVAEEVRQIANDRDAAALRGARLALEAADAKLKEHRDQYRSGCGEAMAVEAARRDVGSLSPESIVKEPKK